VASFVSSKREGYSVEWRVLRGCDFGAPTTRERLFLIARCDGAPIRWPQPTHGTGLIPYRTAAECIDFSIPCPSIFLTTEEANALGKVLGRRIIRPLKYKTMRRVARGTYRFVIDAAEPFIVPVTHAGDDRSHAATEPLRTITGANRGEFAVVDATIAPFLVPRYGEDPHRNGGPDKIRGACLLINRSRRSYRRATVHSSCQHSSRSTTARRVSGLDLGWLSRSAPSPALIITPLSPSTCSATSARA
jgi:site-specific DNA-cytosine methylase